MIQFTDGIKNISETVQLINNFLENNLKPNGTSSGSGKPNNQSGDGLVPGNLETNTSNKTDGGNIEVGKF